MLVYVQILHAGPLHSAPRLSPLELCFSQVRAGTHRRAQAAGGGGSGGAVQCLGGILCSHNAAPILQEVLYLALLWDEAGGTLPGGEAAVMVGG